MRDIPAHQMGSMKLGLLRTTSKAPLVDDKHRSIVLDGPDATGN